MRLNNIGSKYDYLDEMIDSRLNTIGRISHFSWKIEPVLIYIQLIRLIRNPEDDLANMEQTTSNMQPSTEMTDRLNEFDQSLKHLESKIISLHVNQQFQQNQLFNEELLESKLMIFDEMLQSFKNEQNTQLSNYMQSVAR